MSKLLKLGLVVMVVMLSCLVVDYGFVPPIVDQVQLRAKTEALVRKHIRRLRHSSVVANAP